MLVAFISRLRIGDRLDFAPAREVLSSPRMRSIRRPIPSSSDDVTLKAIPLPLILECDRFRLRHPPLAGIPELADKIKLLGQTTPMLIRSIDDALQLMAGYRRKAALE